VTYARCEARIEFLGYLSRLSELLADSEALVFLDDPLELRTAVAPLEREKAETREPSAFHSNRRLSPASRPQ
jgi:hypothetical protein